MGEAKRRQATATQVVMGLDTRDGGDFEAYLSVAGNVGKRSVPCNGCVSCCYHPIIGIDPSEENPEHLAHLLTEPDVEDGKLRLLKRADGACIHLGDAGCTVYEHRPRVCRGYDCRPWSLLFMHTIFPGGHKSPFWVYQTNTLRGRMLFDAFYLAGRMAHKQLEWEGKPPIIENVYDVARRLMPFVIGYVDEFLASSPDDQFDLLRCDPDKLTPERLRHVMLSLFNTLKFNSVPMPGKIFEL